MPRTFTQKVLRATEFINGLRDDQARVLMATRGFTQKDADEGAALAHKCNMLNMGVVPVASDPELILQIDAQENEWFPLISATLKRRFPEVHDVVFLNLAQTEGIAVVANMGVFLERLRNLETSPDPKHQAARAVLAERGLTEQKLAYMEALVAAVHQPTTTPLPAGPVVNPADAYKEVDEALWQWFLEWSQVARIAIKDRKLLKKLGFLKPGRSAEDDGEDGAEEPEKPGAPVVKPAA